MTKLSSMSNLPAVAGHRRLPRPRRLREHRSRPMTGSARQRRRGGAGGGRRRRGRQRHGRPVAAVAAQDRKLVDVPGHRRDRCPDAEDPDGDGGGARGRDGPQRRRDGVPHGDQKRRRRHGRDHQLAGARRDAGRALSRAVVHGDGAARARARGVLGPVQAARRRDRRRTWWRARPGWRPIRRRSCRSGERRRRRRWRSAGP